MNSTALVDRLNFAYALTGSKFANQKFDSAHVLALSLMAQPAAKTDASAPTNIPRAKYAKATLTAEVDTPNQQSPGATGQDIALHVLESALIGGEVSVQTNQLIHKQITSLSAANSTDTLNLLTALVMGSPEFQLR
jgi:hypothetical protein